MKEFFKVTSPERVLEYASEFPVAGTEKVSLMEAFGRILGEDIVSEADLPGFARSTMDGFAVRAASTFGASEGNPAYLAVTGSVGMGESPDFSVGPGEAVRISTGGMLPEGADSVVMVEHTEAVDDTTIEVCKSVAPGTNMIEKDEDFRKSETILCRGTKLRVPEIGLLASFGHCETVVFKKPEIGIISTGDEIVPADKSPGPGRIRDINTYTLAGSIIRAGGVPSVFGIVRDNYDELFDACSRTLERSDMVLVSGGSSVGSRDFTIEVLSALPDSEILVHGISISPGKPAILARAGDKIVWGLPGHVVSAMVVFKMIVLPFIDRIAGRRTERRIRIPAKLGRNLASAQGRVDYVRVRLSEKDGLVWADPVLGKSGLINTMVKADGLIEIGMNTEGVNKGDTVFVIPSP